VVVLVEQELALLLVALVVQEDLAVEVDMVHQTVVFPVDQELQVRDTLVVIVIMLLVLWVVAVAVAEPVVLVQIQLPDQ
jgi:hypothetical protein